MRIAESNLLIENLDAAVGLAVEWQRQSGIVDARFLAVADACRNQELFWLCWIVEAQIALVGVVGEGRVGGAIVSVYAGGGVDARCPGRDLALRGKLAAEATEFAWRSG